MKLFKINEKKYLEKFHFRWINFMLETIESKAKKRNLDSAKNWIPKVHSKLNDSWN